MIKGKLSTQSSFFYPKRIIGLLLLLTVAAVFLFSGISKLYTLEQLVWNIMDAGVTNMTLASVLARFFIGFELLLGFFLIAHIYLRSFTYLAVIALLLGFTLYLVQLMQQQGDTGNCGCFGDMYAMKPSAGILKNIIMMGIVALLMAIYSSKPYKNSEWIATLSAMVLMVLPFILFPLSGEGKPEIAHEPININPLYNTDGAHPPIELRQGKHIIAFMSLTCSHCKKAAFLLQIIHRQHPKLPIFFVLNGHKNFETSFFEETKSKDVPHILFTGVSDFMQMAGTGVPAIYWVNNSIIERKSNYYQLDPNVMQQWLDEK